MINEEGQGKVLSVLANRPALYGSLLNALGPEALGGPGGP